MDKIQKILNQSLAIRTFPIKEIQDIVNNFTLSNHEEVKVFSSNITEYLKPYCDLSGFDYLYPLNGITEGLNYWMWGEERTIQIRDGDYVWVKGAEQGDVHYWTTPASFDGNYCSIPTDKPVVLDLAHLLSAKLTHFEIPSNVEKVFFSFSKCFGLRNYRIGYYWSRKPDKWLEPLNVNAKYYNYYSMGLGEKLIENIPIDLVYNTLRPIQLEICDELNLSPSDSIWLATSDEMMYNKFKRNYTNRLCIEDLIKEVYYATNKND
jgi:hypothetical protein